ncbi:hypothetical protein E8D34_20320, partial [Nocardioides sp. GY 10113]
MAAVALPLPLPLQAALLGAATLGLVGGLTGLLLGLDAYPPTTSPSSRSAFPPPSSGHWSAPPPARSPGRTDASHAGDRSPTAQAADERGRYLVGRTVRAVSNDAHALPADETDVPTLLDWAGGPPAIRRLMDAFYDRVERDDLLSPLFPGGVSDHHRSHVTDWYVEVFGGPAIYTDEHGGYEAMLAHHKGLAITPAQRHRFVALLSLGADD